MSVHVRTPWHIDQRSSLLTHDVCDDMWLPCMARRVRFIAVHPVNVRHVPSSSIVIRISSYLSIATSAVIGIIGDVVIGCCLLQFTAVRCTCSLCQTHCSPRGLSWRAHHALQALGLLVVSAARDIFLYPPPHPGLSESSGPALCLTYQNLPEGCDSSSFVHASYTRAWATQNT